MLSSAQVSRFSQAAPFWMSFGVVPVVLVSATYGGWTLLLPPIYTWWLFAGLDAIVGRYRENADTTTPDSALTWYRALTTAWVPAQLLLLFSLLNWIPGAAHLTLAEKFGVFFGVGIASGAIGIVYAHELMHQRNRFERWMGDILMASVLYSHFRSEHLLVHHRYVATPRDAVTARYNEGFHRFFVRVLPDCLISAFSAEKALLARKGRPWWYRNNPFWRYAMLQLLMLALALTLGGALGVLLFCFQAFVAVWQLELVNYVEHYGLTREHLGDGKYEHVKPRHSWNSDHRASNWLLINLQRHSDHHYRPDRRFPLLQTYASDEAPQLPYGYPVMTILALIPPAWRRVMNPRVRAWRKRFYPQIKDWGPYKTGSLPLPR